MCIRDRLFCKIAEKIRLKVTTSRNIADHLTKRPTRSDIAHPISSEIINKLAISENIEPKESESQLKFFIWDNLTVPLNQKT